MKKLNRLSKKVLVYETIMIISVISFFWIDEIFDLPHYLFRAAVTPVNIAESLFETVIVLFFGLFVMIITNRFLNHIKYMEGFIYMCSYCKKIKVDNKWIPLDDFLRTYSDAKWSHGLCDDCLKEKLSEINSKKSE